MQKMLVPVEGQLDKLKELTQTVERTALTKALAASGGDEKKAAAMLGISRRKIQYRMEKYDLLGARHHRRGKVVVWLDVTATLDRVERAILQRALVRVGGCMTCAAATVKLSYRQFRYRIAKLEMREGARTK